jgi:hypothetical protein
MELNFTCDSRMTGKENGRVVHDEQGIMDLQIKDFGVEKYFFFKGLTANFFTTYVPLKLDSGLENYQLINDLSDKGKWDLSVSYRADPWYFENSFVLDRKSGYLRMVSTGNSPGRSTVTTYITGNCRKSSTNKF